MIEVLLNIFLLSLLKYVVIFALPYFVFWKWLPNYFKKFKIQTVERQKPKILLELSYSASTLLIQSLFFLSIYYLNLNGVFNIYEGFGSQGYLKEIIAFVVYFIVYDAYFYWSHRLLHYGWLYKKVHVVHHKSFNPTPFASYSFHPIETLLSLIYFYPILYFCGMSLEMFVTLIIITDFGNLAGHLGYDLLPKSISNSKWGSWITTPTHHNIHHQYSRSNFGLYWRGWDEMCKTLHTSSKN
jgi:lathosterol oxidase